jgi:hypothetical protein
MPGIVLAAGDLTVNKIKTKSLGGLLTSSLIFLCEKEKVGDFIFKICYERVVELSWM